MAGDPDELDLLDYDKVAAKWDNWHGRFIAHYGLDEKQQTSLWKMMNGSDYYAAALAKLPDGVKLSDSRVSQKVIRFDPKAQRLIVDGKQHLKPDEMQKLLNLVDGRDDADAKAFRKAVDAAFQRSKRGLGFKEKLAATLKGDPNMLGDDNWQRVGEIEQYRSMLAAYETDLARADQDFEFDHLQHTWSDVQAKRSQLTGPIKALEAEMKEKAAGLLTLDQLARGSVPEPWTKLRKANMATIVGLTVLGAMLIFGFFTRFAALAGAVMLFNFYLAMPPWPGVPEAPGPEHSFIVNKNLIEVFALLAIAVLPTGKWFGLDGFISRWFAGRRARRRPNSTGKPAQQSAAAGTAAEKPGTPVAAGSGGA